MKTLPRLYRFLHDGTIRPGAILADGTRKDCSSIVHDFDETFFAHGGIHALALKIAHTSLPDAPHEAPIAPCVARPSKIVCIGLNYHEHVAEMGSKVLPEPLIFMKASTSLSGASDDLVIPKGSTKMDYEVELAFVIGRTAQYVEIDHALDYIAGYAVMNDYSERAFQKDRGGQFVKGKSADSFGPFGPHLTPREAISDPNDLQLWLKVNGEIRQQSSTALMIFKVPYLVSYLSQFMTLLPGDIISTGTPSGVAMGMNPPRYLQPGDVVEYGVEGLGEMRQRVRAYEAQ